MSVDAGFVRTASVLIVCDFPLVCRMSQVRVPQVKGLQVNARLMAVKEECLIILRMSMRNVKTSQELQQCLLHKLRSKYGRNLLKGKLLSMSGGHNQSRK